jgi:hypothetical protein
MSEPMTAKDRDTLSKIAKQRARIAKSSLAQRQAQLLADFEEQSAAVYSAQDEAWADITREAQELVRRADEQVAEQCRKRGIPEEFRPGLTLSWYGRGQNATASRRAELRKLAERKIDAATKDAKLEIDRADAEVQAELLAGSLTTQDARAFLDRLPTPEQLMPALQLAELEQHLKPPTRRELSW